MGKQVESPAPNQKAKGIQLEVDYTFVQVGIRDGILVTAENCPT